MKQNIITANNDYYEFYQWIEGVGVKKPLLVCDDAIQYMKEFYTHLEELKKRGVIFVPFRDFSPNPLYENVRSAVMRFREENCDSIVAVGGGSAMDVAKCVKLYVDLLGDGENGSWLTADYKENSIPFLVMPTTAGTGSEATRYAVIYHNGSKLSVTNLSLIPQTVLMDPNALKSLPDYQRRATMCDALCHAIESYWSVNSTDESKRYSREAIKGIFQFMDGYLANTEVGNAGMLKAAYTAGKAINITQTTAGHAMCYKITSLFHCAHGHAAILCDRVLFPWMIENLDRCVDLRGAAYLKETLDEIGQALGCENALDGADKLVRIFDSLELSVPAATEEQFTVLKRSVNSDRLKNHPIQLTEEIIDELYRKVLYGALS